MVNSFLLYGVPRLYFGCGSLEKTLPVLKEFGNKYLCITGAKSFSSVNKGKQLLQFLESNSPAFYLEQVTREPSPEIVDEMVRKYHGKEIDAVLSVGGGSVIDAGKAVSAMIPLGEPLNEYLEGVGNKKHPGKKIPFIAIPTTAGTGSEATTNAVISKVGTDGFKRSLRHQNFLPDVAIVDPELTFSCSPQITASSGMDALSQLIESYVSVAANTFTDSIALEGIKLILNNLEKACSNGSDKDARTAMSYASMISGITLANAGLGVVHGFASSIGGLIEIPHGALCGTLVGIANRINVEKLAETGPHNEVLAKYSLLGKMVSDQSEMNNIDLSFRFVHFLEQMTERLRIPRLREYGLKEEDFPKIIAETGQKNNPVKLTSDDLMRILKQRY